MPTNVAQIKRIALFCLCLGLAQPAWADPAADAERLKQLSYDPARKKTDAKSIEEAEVGLALEKAGVIKEKLVRDPSGANEFITADKSQVYDVKSFRSDFAVEMGGFTIESSIKSITKEINERSTTIINTVKMSEQHIKQLYDALSERGLQSRVLWYPADLQECLRLGRLSATAFTKAK